MSKSRRNTKTRLNLREALLLVALTVMTVALIIAVLLAMIDSTKESTPTQTPTTVATVPITTPSDRPEATQTTAPITTLVPTTTPAPTTTTAPVTTPSVTTQPKPETQPPVTTEVEYKIDMTDYMDAVDPSGELWDDAYLLLVNAAHPIAQGQESQYDVLKTRIKFSESKDYDYRWDTGIYLNETAMKALSAMFNEAAADGVKDLDVTSAYRSYSYQSTLFNRNCDKTHHWLCTTEDCGRDWIGKDSKCSGCGKRASEKLPITREEKEANVATYSCAPGTSDHQTGLAVDIVQTSLPSEYDSLIQKFGETEAGKWLAANCYRFGFILRFPPDKQDQTGIIYEPWHFRFVGRTHATAMHDMNLCLEEYVEYLVSIGYFD